MIININKIVLIMSFLKPINPMVKETPVSIKFENNQKGASIVPVVLVLSFRTAQLFFLPIITLPSPAGRERGRERENRGEGRKKEEGIEDEGRW